MASGKKRAPDTSGIRVEEAGGSADGSNFGLQKSGTLRRRLANVLRTLRECEILLAHWTIGTFNAEPNEVVRANDSANVLQRAIRA